MGSFLSNLDYAHLASIDGTFERLTKPTESGKKRLAGVDFNRERIKQVATVLLYLSIKPGGFTSTDLAREMRNRFDPDYSNRNASYDLTKFIGKKWCKNFRDISGTS